MSLANAVLGVSVQGDYTTGGPTNKQIVARLKALIANPAVAPAQAGQGKTPRGAGFLDEMSPAAAIQLHVELAAVEAAITNV